MDRMAPKLVLYTQGMFENDRRLVILDLIFVVHS